MSRRVPRPIRYTDADLRRFWSKVALPDENGCMLWLGTTATGGYGSINFGGVVLRANRLALQIAIGDPSSPDLLAAHSCRNRHCVAPAHLRWATQAENAADKWRDGTMNHGEGHGIAKLTDEQVREIRSRYAAGCYQRKLASEFGVGQATISQIVNRRVWTHISDGAA